VAVAEVDAKYDLEVRVLQYLSQIYSIPSLVADADNVVELVNVIELVSLELPAEVVILVISIAVGPSLNDSHV
jgi:hypothetical protein